MDRYFDKLQISEAARELLLINTLVSHEINQSILEMNLKTSHLNYRTMDLNEYGINKKIFIVLLTDLHKNYILIDINCKTNDFSEKLCKRKYDEVTNSTLKQYIQSHMKEAVEIKVNIEELFTKKIKK